MAENRQYHYIRYAMFFAYLVALAQVPVILKTTGFPGRTLRIFYMMLTVLAVVIDWRNFYLHRRELRQSAAPGPITVAIAIFYFVVLLWFAFTKTIV